MKRAFFIIAVFGACAMRNASVLDQENRAFLLAQEVELLAELLFLWPRFEPMAIPPSENSNSSFNNPR